MALHFPNLFFAFVGISLTFLFITFMAMLVTLIGQVVAEHTFSRARKLLALVLLALFGVAMLQGLKSIGPESLDDFPQWVQSVSNSMMGRILLSPFEPFCLALSAKSFPTFAFWTSIASTINLVLFGAILLLDANYLETAVRVSQKIFDQKRHIQKTGNLSTKLTEKSTRRRIPMLPRLQGFGPIAWRQLVTVLRQSQGIMVIIGIIVASFSLPLVLDFEKKILESPFLVGFVLGALAYVSIIFSLQSPFGFRADIDHIEVYKSLPIRSFNIVAGELVGAVALFTIFQWAVLIGGMILAPKWLGWWAAGMLFAVPYNLLIFGMANGLFLLFPVRSASGAKDIQMVGQAMMFSFAQLLTMVIVSVLCAIPAGITYWLTRSTLLTGGVALAVLSVVAAASLWFATYAYDRFDVANKPA